MKAAEENFVDIMDVLLTSGAVVELQNNKGRTALSFAAAPSAKRPTATGALKKLLEAKADITTRDHKGRTALEHAKREKRSEAVAILVAFCEQEEL